MQTNPQAMDPTEQTQNSTATFFVLLLLCRKLLREPHTDHQQNKQAKWWAARVVCFLQVFRKSDFLNNHNKMPWVYLALSFKHSRVKR